MSANVLVIEYEPRYIDRIRKALSSSGYMLEVVGDVDVAVEACAAFEPQLVVITSVLPRVKIEDAITQLRARAGLPAVPFLILMSGYRGENPEEDAVRYGAQDILERPFAGELLIQKVERLLSKPASPAATQAIPQDMLEALRRSAGLNQGDGGSMTSDELFGDILSDVEEDSQVTDVPVTPSKAPVARAKKSKADDAGSVSSGVDDALAGILGLDKVAPPVRRAAPTTETDVDMILSQTLAGLDIQPVRAKAKKKALPAEPEKKEPPKPEKKKAEKAKTQAKAAEEKAVSQEPKAKPAKEMPPPKEVKSSPPPAKETTKDQPSAKKSSAPPVADKVAPPSSVPPAKEKPTPPVEAPATGSSDGDATSGTQFGQYILKDHIATGGMAEVYQARMMGMEGFQKTVAIKRILPHLTDNDEFVTMFIDEAKLAAQLNHNNIIHIYDLGKIDRSYYIAMEYIDGRDLRSILQECRDRDERIPTSLSLYVTTLLGSALDYAHKKRDFENRDLGLVHRDVSPQNVLISNDGLIKLCDFGIAKAASKASHTRAGALKGKLQYMSPEQAWGKDIDHRSDIFSLGVVLYEMLTNTKVFAGDSELSILEQVRSPQIPNPSELVSAISEDVAEIVMKALEADRDQRYQSARDLQHDIDRVMRRKGWAPGATAVATFVGELVTGEPISGHSGRQPGDDTATDVAASTPVKDVDEQKEGKKKSRKAKKKVKDPVVAKTEKALPVVMPDSKPAPVVEEVADVAPSEGEKTSSKTLLYAAIAALVVVVGGLGYFFSRGGSQSPPTPTPTPIAVVAMEPTATPTVVDDMQALEAKVDAELARREQEMRDRVDQEFPTPTPIPPTQTPTATPVPTEVPTATPTAKPTSTPRPRATAVPTAIPPTPTPSVREGDIVVRGPGVTSPVIVHQVDPQYPKVALRMRASGEVEVQILVGIDGSVEDVKIISVSRTGMGFEKETTNAISQWRYKPATKNGVKVRMWVPYRVPFRAR